MTDPYPIIDRGRRAAELMENQTLDEALTALQEDSHARWLASHSRDIDGREVLYHETQAILALRTMLQAWVEDAKFEAAKLEKIEQRRNRRN